jgi:hypothetical protein
MSQTHSCKKMAILHVCFCQTHRYANTIATRCAAWKGVVYREGSWSILQLFLEGFHMVDVHMCIPHGHCEVPRLQIANLRTCGMSAQVINPTLL